MSVLDEGTFGALNPPFSRVWLTSWLNSLALMELRVILSKMLWSYDMEAVNPDVEWLNQKAYVLWEKPELTVRYIRRAGIVVPPIDG